MKKLVIILISIFLLLSSFALGFYVKKHIDDKKIFVLSIEKNNLQIVNKDLIRQIKNLEHQISEYNNQKEDNEEEYKHPIDIKEKKCIEKVDNAADIRNCVYLAAEEWEKEINKYIKLLEQSTTKEQFKLIKDSQNLWLQQSKKDNDIINEFIFNHGGTIYYDIAAGDYEELIKNRAEFLKWVYEIHTDKIP